MVHDTLMRQWTILKMLPRFPLKVSTDEVVQHLMEQGFTAELRTVQRDLQKLSSIFPLFSDVRDKPYGWSWAQDAHDLNVLSMDAHTALAFYLVEQHLKPVLPQETLKGLSIHFNTAHQVLDKQQSTLGSASWMNKVRVLRQGPDWSLPEIQGEVQGQVYSALLMNRQLHVVYKASAKAESKAYTIHPLALVSKDGMLYMVCVFSGYQDVRLLALHRMEEAKVLNARVVVPKGFDVDAYIASGELHFRIGETIKLKALVSSFVAMHLRERKLAPDQTLAAYDDEWMLLQVTVLDTYDLRFWLRGYAEHVQILAPSELRESLYESALAQVENYEEIMT